MNDLMQRTEHVLRYTERFYQRLCAFCERPLGLATRPAREDLAPCDHGRELLAQARGRRKSLGRPAPEPVLGAWVQAPLGQPGLLAPAELGRLARLRGRCGRGQDALCSSA